MFSFGHCPNQGGGGGGEALARIFWPFFYHVIVPKIGNFLPKTLYICMFLVIFVIIIIKITIIIIIATVIIIIGIFSVIRAKRRF